MKRHARTLFAATVVAALTLVVAPAQAIAAGPVLAWSGRTAMPTARYSMSAATTLDGDIVVSGGLTVAGGGFTAAVERYHPATDTWTSLAPMLTPRYNTAAVTEADGTILVIGGFPPGQDSSSIVEAYDPATNTWSPRSNYPVNAAGPSAVRGPDGTVYAFGGYPGCCFVYLSNVYAYDPATDTWSTRAPMPTPRQSSAATLGPDGKIYVVGGNGTGPIERTVEAYDPATNTWQTKSPMPMGSSGLGLVAAPDGHLYAFGFPDGSVLRYDIPTDTWTPVEPLPTLRGAPVVALGGDGNMYVIGGFVDATNQTTAVTERASLTSQPAAPVYNVATGTKTTSTNQSITATATTAVPAGDTLTVSVATGTFAGAVGCTDSQANTYTVVADKNTGNGRLFVCSTTLTAPLTPGDTVTATYPRFSGLSVATANAITATTSSGTVDQAATNSGNNPDPTSGSVTTQHATELLFGVIAHNSVPTLTPGPGFTAIGAITGGTGSGTRTVTPEYMLVTTTGSYTATATLSSGQQWRAAIITYP